MGNMAYSSKQHSGTDTEATRTIVFVVDHAQWFMMPAMPPAERLAFLLASI